MTEKNEFQQLVGDTVRNWKGVDKPTPMLLQGRYCTLEPMNIDKHAETLFANLLIDNKGESWTYLPYGPFYKIEDFRQWLVTTMSEDDTQLYAILDRKGVPVGVCGYMRINPLHGVIEIGHLHYSKLLQRTPATTEAMYLMMRHAFDAHGYRRYEWKCHSFNEPSRQAALRLGFQYEGLFRQANVFRGRNRDTAWFSIIDSEWPGIKERFEIWLDPKNFDAQGQQLHKLGLRQ
jgi:RimJ/RimL family protein N-acetyltransferase